MVYSSPPFSFVNTPQKEKRRVLREHTIPSLEPHQFSMRCGNAAIGKRVREGLEAAGFQHDLAASIVIIIDANQGFALRQL